MKKLQKAFLLYFSLIIFSVFIQGCCTNTYTIIGNGTLSAYSIDEPYTPIDTIIGEFILRNEYETRFSSLEEFSIISSTMATSCAQEYTNKLETQSVKISCDQDFTFDGNTISADTDFSNLEELKIDSQQFENNLLELHFHQSFIDKVTFENQEYIFTVSIATDNGLDFENQVTILMNL